MSRRRKIALIVGGGIAGLLLILVVAAILIVRTAWFGNFVRQKIVASVEESTGGKVEVKSFHFEWTHLRADIRGFVVHGLEPPGAAPLLSIQHLQVDLKLTSPFTGFVDIAYLLVDTPRANVMVFPNGQTNIPAPRLKQPSQKSGLETVVDLAIGKFDLLNGAAQFADQPARFDATGQNLRAHLTYNTLHPGYSGEIDIDPLLLQSGRQQPVAVQVKLPVSMEKDKISLANAQLTTARSKVLISGEMNNMNDPHTTAHLNAEVALDDVRRAAGLDLPLDLRSGPQFVQADITAAMDSKNIDLQSARVTLGSSDLEAKGTLKSPHQPGNVQFNATLTLGQIGHLLKLPEQPEGTVKLGGNAEIQQNNVYVIHAKVDARNVSLREDGKRLSGIDLDADVTADPQRIQLADLKLAALGGGFTGSASIEDLRTFQVSGTLHHFDIDRLAQTFLDRRLGYDGLVSGPIEAGGDLKNPKALTARASLGIAPGGHGIPVSGKLNVNYSARADNVVLGQSYVALPHSRLDLSGALGRQIDVRLVSHNLDDFRPLGNLPVTLNNGSATVNAVVTGSLSAPRITAHAALANFAVDGRPFSSFTGDVAASQSGATVTNAVLARGPLQARLSGSVGLDHWSPKPFEPLRVDATVRNADVSDVLALANQTSFPATGALTADIHLAGTVGSPTGSADLAVANGTLEGEPFDSLTARANMTQQSIDVPSLALVAGASRLDAAAHYRHAVNDLENGSLQAHVASNQVQLAQLQALVKNRPGLRGTLSLNADAAADVRPARSGANVEFTHVNGNLSVHGLQLEGRNLGDLTATAATAGNAVQYNVSSDFAGSAIHLTGSSLLADDHATTATAQIANLPIEPVLALAGESGLPVSGTLSANGQVSGTLQNPHATVALTVVKGSAYQQPFDRLQADLTYSNTAVDLSNFRVAEGPSYLTASGSFQHPAGDWQDGQARFNVKSNQFQLTQLRALQNLGQGLSGTVQISASGAATLRQGRPPLVSALDADLEARGLTADRVPLGDLTATARTQGQAVDFNLASNLGHSNIHGTGRLQLTAGYPASASLSFTNLTYSGLRPLLGGEAEPIEAVADGSATVSGPLENIDALRGSVRIAKFDIHSAPGTLGRQPRVNFDLDNAGPIVVALDRSVVTVQSAHLRGRYADLNVTGTAALSGARALNLRADGNLNLELLEAFSADIYSAGSVILAAAVTGTASQPAVNGRLTLQHASLNLADVPNGLSNGNGEITFTGTQAVIQNLTGESGGGKVTLAGMVAYGGPELQVRVTATADRVRVEYPDSVSTEASARISLMGTTSRSVLAGNVTILDVALHSHSDVGSLLTQAATPPPAQSATTGFLGGLHFDVRIQTAPDVQFRTTLTQNLQAEANLTLRGTVDHPGMLGRVNVTEGNVVFFGAKYTIDQGSIAFYDPNRINPYLNIDLETTVQGIDVSLSVTGPMDRMKLAYRSDPPMQFTDLVSLLASGRTPSTDPVLAAHTPVAPEQNFQQAGASALFGAAVANPVSGRLQRLFGVTSLKINPQIVGTSNTAIATMTLQQQITRDLTFTYIQDVTQTNPQIVRMEWDISPTWSAIAQRDNYGFFDLDFFWKKRFH
jgi:translocation and assembly module TamB